MIKSSEIEDNKNSNNLLSVNPEKNQKSFFKIFYDYDKHIYYLMDLGKGYGTFFKIEEDVAIKENTIINIGDSYLIFSFRQKYVDNEEDIDEDDWYLKIYSNEREYELIIMPSTKDKIYQIGRSDKCDVYIRDRMLSRIHCILFYIDNNWYIKDGNGNGNESTNGTWLYANEETEIHEGMRFKSNSCNFYCKFQ